MKDAKGNKVGIGTLLYANLGKYGPCTRIADFKIDPFQMGCDCVYLEEGSVHTNEYGEGTFIPDLDRKPFPVSLESLATSKWSATRTFWQELAVPFRKWWYEFRAELKKALATYKD
jgi:hypothetical protein